MPDIYSAALSHCYTKFVLLHSAAAASQQPWQQTLYHSSGPSEEIFATTAAWQPPTQSASWAGRQTGNLFIIRRDRKSIIVQIVAALPSLYRRPRITRSFLL
jgi:hypothetical protein